MTLSSYPKKSLRAGLTYSIRGNRQFFHYDTGLMVGIFAGAFSTYNSCEDSPPQRFITQIDSLDSCRRRLLATSRRNDQPKSLTRHGLPRSAVGKSNFTHFSWYIGRVVAALAVASTLFSKALAHGGVLAYGNAGAWYDGWHPYNSASGQVTIQRPWATYNPITTASDPTIACNDDGTEGASGWTQLTATVAAGSKITAYWNQVWPHAIGPMLTYLASCPGSCTGVNAATLKWFKIDQAGLLSGTVGSGSWADGKMIADNSSWTTTIPSTVPSGNYLIRFETIALHSLPAQFYPECAQLTITGGGSLAPTAAQLVTFPGGYSDSDPGINLDVYSNAAQTQTTYVIPGPPLYGSGSTSPPPPPPPSSSSSSTKGPSTTSKPTSTTSTTSTKSSSAPVTSSTAKGTVGQYGQCGGTGWTGGTVCISPFVCTYSNAYYSQCL